MSEPTQLDRIEAKLDVLLARKRSANSGARQSTKATKQRAHDAAVNAAPLTDMQRTDTKWMYAWHEYCNMRREEEPLTAGAIKRCLSKLAKATHLAQIEALYTSADNRYKGVFPKESDGKESQEEWG